MAVALRIQELKELIHGQPGLAKNRAKRPTIERAMVGYDGLGEGVIATHDDMTADLSADGKAGPLSAATHSRPEITGS